MKNSVRISFIALLGILMSLINTNNSFAQGQGQGNGQGLLENRGIGNGQGFTTGQGHLNGNSAVDLTDCVEEGMAFYYNEWPNRIIERIDENSFSVKTQIDWPWGGSLCFIYYYTVMVNEQGDCEYIRSGTDVINGGCN